MLVAWCRQSRTDIFPVSFRNRALSESALAMNLADASVSTLSCVLQGSASPLHSIAWLSLQEPAQLLLAPFLRIKGPASHRHHHYTHALSLVLLSNIPPCSLNRHIPLLLPASSCRLSRLPRRTGSHYARIHLVTHIEVPRHRCRHVTLNMVVLYTAIWPCHWPCLVLGKACHPCNEL